MVVGVYGLTVFSISACNTGYVSRAGIAVAQCLLAIPAALVAVACGCPVAALFRQELNLGKVGECAFFQPEY